MSYLFWLFAYMVVGELRHALNKYAKTRFNIDTPQSKWRTKLLWLPDTIAYLVFNLHGAVESVKAGWAAAAAEHEIEKARRQQEQLNRLHRSTHITKE